MKNLLIGSRALDYWHDLGIARTDSDWDVISDSPIKGYEWHNPDVLNNKRLEKYADSKHVITHQGNELYVMPLYVLAAIKRSHLHRSVGFGKSITHYHKHLASYKFSNITEYNKILDERKILTEQQYPQRYPKLNKTVGEFFDDAVTKVFCHDYLHELVAFEDKPMYTKLQKDTDGDSVMCYNSLWNNLKQEQKLRCVMEECYVIALERFIIPEALKGKKYPSKLAYMKALEKVCTTLCSGYFREYAIENYPWIVQNFSESKVQYVLSKLNLKS